MFVVQPCVKFERMTINIQKLFEAQPDRYVRADVNVHNGLTPGEGATHLQAYVTTDTNAYNFRVERDGTVEWDGPIDYIMLDAIRPFLSPS